MKLRTNLNFWERQILRAADYAVRSGTNPNFACSECGETGPIVELKDTPNADWEAAFVDMPNLLWITCAPKCGHEKYTTLATFEHVLGSYFRSFFGER